MRINREELPDDIRTHSVEFLRETMKDYVRDNLRTRIAANPSNWWNACKKLSTK